MLEYKEFVTSPPFVLLAGPNSKSYTIHSALLASVSKPFDILVNGQMKEAQDRIASLEDVDEATMVRFIEFLYTGDYSEDAESLIEKDRSRISTTSSTKDYGSELSYFDIPISFTIPKFKPLVMRSFKEDYTKVYLSHARVWAFADFYDMDTLKDISLQKIQKNLLHHKVSIERFGDFVELVRYAYTHTLHRNCEPDDGNLDLRNLIAEYAACMRKEFRAYKDFISLKVDFEEFWDDVDKWEDDIRATA